MDTYIRKINGQWYAFEGRQGKNGYQALSIGADDPESGRWFGPWTDDGISYVATPSPNRKAAYQKARRAGNYCGEG